MFNSSQHLAKTREKISKQIRESLALGNTLISYNLDNFSTVGGNTTIPSKPDLDRHMTIQSKSHSHITAIPMSKAARRIEAPAIWRNRNNTAFQTVSTPEARRENSVTDTFNNTI